MPHPMKGHELKEPDGLTDKNNPIWKHLAPIVVERMDNTMCFKFHVADVEYDELRGDVNISGLGLIIHLHDRHDDSKRIRVLVNMRDIVNFVVYNFEAIRAVEETPLEKETKKP